LARSYGVETTASVGARNVSSIRNRVLSVILQYPTLLSKAGLVERDAGTTIFQLALPVMVTGGLRMLLRTADLVMVSHALGPAAVAGLQFGFQYYFVMVGLALALSSGTISVVARLAGAAEYARANLAVKQSFWLATLLGVPLTALFIAGATHLIGLLTNDPRVIAQGATYLQILSLSAVFRLWSMVGARAFAAVDDTVTPMYIRAISLPTNVVLNAVLIFGLGPFPALGLAGAAWGTSVANTLAACCFVAALLSGHFDVRLPIRGRQFDATLWREILQVGTPLAGVRLVQSGGRFPLLYVLATLGTEVVAAYAIARQIMLLAMMPSWGFSTAASTLVGQQMGTESPRAALAACWQTVRISLSTQLLIAGTLAVFAPRLAMLFDSPAIELTAQFIRVFAIAIAGFSLERALRGGLRGIGDTRWPFYGTVAGIYLVRLPIALLALPVSAVLSVGSVAVSPGLGLGLGFVYLALVGDFYVRAIFNVFRIRTGPWQRAAA
jgi:putative MATE family efflux protein